MKRRVQKGRHNANERMWDRSARHMWDGWVGWYANIGWYNGQREMLGFGWQKIVRGQLTKKRMPLRQHGQRRRSFTYR